MAWGPYAVEGPILYAATAIARDAGRFRLGVQRLRRHQKDKLRVTDGVHSIALFEMNPGSIVSFCKLCGSSLFALVRHGQLLHVKMGTLAEDPGIRPMCHVFVGSKAPWHEITDSLPQYAGLPPTEALAI